MKRRASELSGVPATSPPRVRISASPSGTSDRAALSMRSSSPVSPSSMTSVSPSPTTRCRLENKVWRNMRSIPPRVCARSRASPSWAPVKARSSRPSAVRRILSPAPASDTCRGRISPSSRAARSISTSSAGNTTRGRPASDRRRLTKRIRGMSVPRAIDRPTRSTVTSPPGIEASSPASIRARANSGNPTDRPFGGNASSRRSPARARTSTVIPRRNQRKARPRLGRRDCGSGPGSVMDLVRSISLGDYRGVSVFIFA